MAGVKGKSGPQKARLNPRHQQMVIEKIRATQIIKRLAKHVAGKLEMSPTQVRAAEILLKKCVPDRKSVEHSGDMTFTHKNMSRDQIDGELISHGIDPKTAFKGLRLVG